MHFTPFNRHLVVDLVEEKKEEQDSFVVLPTDYERPQSAYAKVTVLEVSPDSKLHDKLSLNDTILVERRMLHKVDIKQNSFYLVLENYVYGRITDEINT